MFPWVDSVTVWQPVSWEERKVWQIQTLCWSQSTFGSKMKLCAEVKQQRSRVNHAANVTDVSRDTRLIQPRELIPNWLLKKTIQTYEFSAGYLLRPSRLSCLKRLSVCEQCRNPGWISFLLLFFSYSAFSISVSIEEVAHLIISSYCTQLWEYN